MIECLHQGSTQGACYSQQSKGSQAIDEKHQIRDARLVVAIVANAMNSVDMQ